MKNKRRRPTTHTATPAIDAAIELGKNALGKLDLRPMLGLIIDEHEARATADLPTPEEAITTCHAAVTALGLEDAHAGSIMTNAMGSLRKAHRRSMGKAGACIGRGDRKGAQRHLIEAEKLEQTIKIVDAREPINELFAAFKNVRITVEGVAGTFPISGAHEGATGYKYVRVDGVNRFMRV